MNTLCKDNKGILNANVKEETFDELDFIKDEIDPLYIGFQDENDRSCFNIRLKSEENEDFVKAKDELLLVEDGLVLEGFRGQSANGSNIPLKSTIKEEEETVDDMDFVNEEMDPLNVGLQNNDCGGLIKIKLESEEWEGIDVVKEEFPLFASDILNEDKSQPVDKCEDDPKLSTSSDEAMNVLGSKHLRVHSSETSKSELNQEAVENSFECDVCFKSFDSKQSFTRHFNTHFQNKKFMCNICDKKFTRKGYLKDHMRIHSLERPFECDVCENRFTHKQNLKVHLRVHSGERPFECDVCEKRFTYKRNLKTHLRIHSSEKPLECTICKKYFTLRGNLNYHMQVHTGERPFECDICEKKIASKQGLKKHLRIHSRERPFECNICNKSFPHRSHLNYHMKVHSQRVCAATQTTDVRLGNQEADCT